MTEDSSAEPKKILTDAEEQEMYEKIRLLQEAGTSEPRLDEWAARYEQSQVFRAEHDLKESDGEFVILAGNNKTGRVNRAIGPISGRLMAEGLATRLSDMYQQEWAGFTLEWTAVVVPLDRDVAGWEQEIEWITSGRADEEAATEEHDDEPGDADGRE